MNSAYDIIVVGAGPAGSTAGRFAAAAGASVLVLEKDRDVGYPVRCGEAVSHEGLIQFIEPDPRWIAATVTRFRMISPSGKVVHPKLEGTGYVLERRIFDYEIAKLAASSGAEIVTKAYVYDLLRDAEGNAVGVKALLKDRPVEIRARVVIGADGVESRVGRWAGMETACHIRDMESCAQMTIGGIDVDQDTLEFVFGDAVSPGGYLWVFPKGKKTANVGIGISVEKAKRRPALLYLQEFVAKRYPSASILTQIAGGVPCARTCDTIVRNRVMIVGDAAHQVNPISGGGIISGMIGGMMAGEIAAQAVKSGDFSLLGEYQSRWHKRLGWRHEIFYNIKEVAGSFSDETLDRIADAVLAVPPEKRTLGGIFRAAMWNQPTLLFQVAKVFLS